MSGEADLRVSIGFASLTGRRPRNEDFVGACTGDAAQVSELGVVAAIADGMGGAPGGREAAETAVRNFLDGYLEQPATLGIRKSAAHVLQSLNSWLVAQGRSDPNLAGMGTTFTALILRGRNAHVVHVGDTRAYRFSGGRLSRLTEDHALKQPGLTHVLYRAMGIEDVVRLDYAVHPALVHDRFLLCSDGVHGAMTDARIADILDRRASPEETAQSLVADALAQGSEDNATVLVMDVLALPVADRIDIGRGIAPLPIRPMPRVTETIDGFRLTGVLADGRYSRLFTAIEIRTGETVVLKFPHPAVASEATYKAAFLRESWVAARVRNPWVASVIDLPEGHRTCLYSAMPLYKGETLERRLLRLPRMGLPEGRRIALQLCKAVAALHRVGMVHRDIKPDNILIEADGGLKLLDLGVARVPGLEDFPAPDIPGTPSYMAPEMFNGEKGNARTDLYALAATLFRMFTGLYPQGEIEPFTHPRFNRRPSLSKHRPDLPVWLDEVLGRALSVDPAARHHDVQEFLNELETGPMGGEGTRRRIPLYQRNPVLFWQLVSGLLLAALVLVRC